MTERSRETNEQRIVIAGGGTGGHVNPGLAIASELMRRRPDRSALFVGTRGGLEARLVPAAGFPLETIRASGLVGKGIGETLQGLARLPLGWLDSDRILRRFRPHLVVGVGGYASGPVLLAALDNLVKGASGQALQCANLMAGHPEEMGLLGGAQLP